MPAEADEILLSTYALGEFPARDEPSHVYTIKPNASGQTALTVFGKAEQRATQPTWTADGSRITFTLIGNGRPAGTIRARLHSSSGTARIS